MHKRHPEFFVIDILIAIDKLNRKIVGLSFEEFLSDEDAVDVTMRNLEIIGEAASQLLKHPDFLEKTDIVRRRSVDCRNVLIHFYFGVDLSLVFNEVVQKKVPKLEQDIMVFMEKKKDKIYFLDAIQSATVDLKKLHRHESIAYLEEVKRRLNADT